ncbi:MAG: DNA-3-methyladenine glycosylase family protein [Alphaproteobacteria bacterium]
MNARVDADFLGAAVAELARRDGDFARVVARHGLPALRIEPGGFLALLRIIVEQQLSVASAAAIWGRVESAMVEATPRAFLALDDAALRACGLSRPKIAYGRSLAGTVLAGALDVDGLAHMDDEAAIAALIQIKGIGRWTAEIYLLSALARPDIWPAGDLAVATAAGHLKGMKRRPSEDELRAMGEAWRPFRAVAARLLWHFFRGEKLRPLAPPLAKRRRAKAKGKANVKIRAKAKSHKVNAKPGSTRAKAASAASKKHQSARRGARR